MDIGDYPRTVTATADSFNEAVEKIRSELPGGVHILSTILFSECFEALGSALA